MTISIDDVARRVYAASTGLTEDLTPPVAMATKRGPLGVLIATGDRFAAARALRETGDPVDAAIAQAAENVAQTFFAVAKREGATPDQARVWAWDEEALEALRRGAEEAGLA